jgi:hypothetical protein
VKHEASKRRGAAHHPESPAGRRSALSRVSRLKSVVLTVTELLGAGSRRGGLVALAVLTSAGLLLPLLLLIVFADGTSGSAVLGLMLSLRSSASSDAQRPHGRNLGTSSQNHLDPRSSISGAVYDSHTWKGSWDNS